MSPASRTTGGRAAPPASLLAMHRHGRSSLLVLGGSEGERLEVVRAFHEAGLARRGRLVAVRCADDEPVLRRALQLWLTAAGDAAEVNPLRACEDGTLYLEGVHALAEPMQRQLVVLARRIAGESPDGRAGALPLRLAAGDADGLDAAVEQRRFSAALLDCIDKIRVDLRGAGRRGAA